MAWTYSLNELADAIGAAPVAEDTRFTSVSTDTRSLRPGAVFFALSGERFDGQTFVDKAFEQGAAAAVTRLPVSSGPHLVVADPLAALQAFAARHRARLQPALFALTGSCGKTTAKEMTAALLATKHRVVKTQGNLNNEIGCPLSLLQMDASTEVAVIEMGANHPGEIARLCTIARPTESAITLIAPAHLEGFGTVERVAEAKGEIIAGLPADGLFYVNTDDPACVRLAERHPGRIVRFGRSGDVALRACTPTSDHNGLHLTIDPIGAITLPLHCRALVTNVLLAVAVALEHDVDTFEEPLRAVIEAATNRFRVYRKDGVEIIDDTYNANPASMRAALEALAQRPARARHAVLGDMLELGASAQRLHEEVGELAGRLGIDRLYLRGDHAARVADAALRAGVKRAQVAQEHEALAALLGAALRPGDTVLFKGSRGMQMERVISALRIQGE